MIDKTALIIEDDEDLATIFGEAVRSAGYEAEVIGTGDTALSRLAEVTPGIVVLDLHLPKVAGLSILRQMKAEPRLADVRVIIVTADARLAEVPRGEADVVLIKPISFSLLRDLAARFYADSGEVL
jgi:two-component system, OmpR family, phosphate regulon response regulator PhoB